MNEQQEAWEKWILEAGYTLFRSSVIQEQFIQCVMDNTDSDGTILETGFGFGVTTELFRDLGYNITGFDILPMAIDTAVERFPHLKDRLFVGDILDESSYTDFYDTIIHQGVLEHFSDEDILKILDIQSKKCKNIIFDVPNNLRENTDDEGDDTRFESPQFWEDMVSKVGLEYKRYGRTYDYGNNLLPKELGKYDSDLMKRVGRSTIMVVKGINNEGK